MERVRLEVLADERAFEAFTQELTRLSPISGLNSTALSGYTLWRWQQMSQLERAPYYASANGDEVDDDTPETDASDEYCGICRWMVDVREEFAETTLRVLSHIPADPLVILQHLIFIRDEPIEYLTGWLEHVNRRLLDLGGLHVPDLIKETEAARIKRYFAQWSAIVKSEVPDVDQALLEHAWIALRVCPLQAETLIRQANTDQSPFEHMLWAMLQIDMPAPPPPSAHTQRVTAMILPHWCRWVARTVGIDEEGSKVLYNLMVSNFSMVNPIPLQSAIKECPWYDADDRCTIPILGCGWESMCQLVLSRPARWVVRIKEAFEIDNQILKTMQEIAYDCMFTDDPMERVAQRYDMDPEIIRIFKNEWTTTVCDVERKLSGIAITQTTN